MIDRLKQWSEHLCRTAGDPAETARALALTGTLAEHGDYADLTPAPAGTAHVLLVRGVGGVGHLDVRLVEPVTRGELDARFGEGAELPLMPDRPSKIAYHVELPGAPFSCEVIAAFEGDPTQPAASAHGIVLRRDRA